MYSSAGHCLVKFGSSDLFITLFRISEFCGNLCSERQRFHRETYEISDPNLHNFRLIFDTGNLLVMLLDAWKFNQNGLGKNIICLGE